MNIINKYISQLLNKTTAKVDQKIDNLLTSEAISNINTFKKAITDKGGLSHTNQFLVNIAIPDAVNKALISLSSVGLPDYDDEISILCYKANIPSRKLKTTPINIYNNLQLQIPQGYEWGNLILSFIERRDLVIKNLFDNWINTINNPVTNAGSFYDDVVSAVKVNLLNKSNNIEGYIAFDKALPISTTMSELNWDTTNQYISIDVEWAYIYQTTSDFSTVAVIDTLTSIKNTSIYKTVNQVLKWF